LYATIVGAPLAYIFYPGDFDNIPIGESSIQDFMLGSLNNAARIFREIWDTAIPFENYAFHDGPSVGVFFYSTFLTSIWIWLYAAGIYTIRMMHISTHALKLLKWILPIRSKPLRAVGTAAFIPPIVISGFLAAIS
jgi:hypothetical protein